MKLSLKYCLLLLLLHKEFNKEATISVFNLLKAKPNMAIAHRRPSQSPKYKINIVCLRDFFLEAKQCYHSFSTPILPTLWYHPFSTPNLPTLWYHPFSTPNLPTLWYPPFSTPILKRYGITYLAPPSSQFYSITHLAPPSSQWTVKLLQMPKSSRTGTGGWTIKDGVI